MLVEDSIFVNAAAIGIGCGGVDVICRKNKIYSANDPELEYAKVGIGVWNGDPPCDGVIIEDNEVTFWQAAAYMGSASSFLNPDWKSGSCAVDLSTNRFDTAASQPAQLKISLWSQAWDTPGALPDNPYHCRD